MRHQHSDSSNLRRGVAFRTRAIGAAVLLAASGVASAAEPYPTRPIRLVVPFAPGGGTDIIARLIGQSLGEAWGQSVVVDNRTGAGGVIGVTLVAKSIPDGYTMLLASNGPLTFLPALGGKLPYDPERDLVPVSLAASQPFVIASSNASGIQSIKDLVAAAKANPGKLTFGSGGAGGASQLGFELLKVMAGISVVHVAYKGTGPSLTAVAANEVQFSMGGISSVMPLAKAGRLKALAVTTAGRSPAMPDVPTVSEAGVSGYEFDVWYGLLFAAGTARGIVQKTSAEVARLAKQPAVRERYSALGMEPTSSTPEAFASLIKRDVATWKKVVATANIKLE